HHLDLHSFPTRRSSDLDTDDFQRNSLLSFIHLIVEFRRRVDNWQIIHIDALGISEGDGFVGRIADIAGEGYRASLRKSAAFRCKDRKSTRLNSSHLGIS